MRFVVLGAGAVGGVVGARLAEHGHDVALVARGPHYQAIRRDGLLVRSAGDDLTLHVPVVDDVRSIAFSAGDVVLLATKTQDSAAALAYLAGVAPPDTPIVCVQNGVENERLALRSFRNVYGVPVMCPTTFVEPGAVHADSWPTTGILDVGAWPTGVDDIAEAVAEAFARSTFESAPRANVARWKYRKLLLNLGNAAEALCGPAARAGEAARRATEEGERCLAVAGIDAASAEEDRARRAGHLRTRADRQGGSTWQSLHRRTGTVETDYLNGEIVLLGRLHGVPTPVNELLQRLATDSARNHRPPGEQTEAELLALLPPAP